MRFLINIINSFRLFNEKEDFNTVIDGIEKGIPFRGTNLWILIFAIFIASLGLNVNSTAVIIGAMLISPLMGPIMGMGLSLGINDLAMLKKSIYNYGFATVIGLATSTFYFIISPINDAHSEILARTQPNIYDVLIAFFGGLAGVLASSSKQKGNVIPGVAIATALMPPLCTAGFGLATMQWRFFIGAFYLFVINTVFIALATLITVKYLHFPVKHLVDAKAEKKNKKLIWFIIILTILPSIFFSYQFVRDTRFQSEANAFIEKYSKLPNEYLLNKKINPQAKTVSLVYGGAKLTEADSTKLQMQFQSNHFFDGARLEINQGFSYLAENNKELTLSNTISQKDASILQMQAQMDSLNKYANITPQLFNEAKIFLPKIEQLSLQNHLIAGDSSKKNLPVCLIRAAPPLNNEEILKMNFWLKKRMGLDSVEVLNN